MCAYENAGDLVPYDAGSPVLSSEFMIVTPQSDDGTPLMIKTLAECIEGVLPISKGGTGISELEGGNLVASGEDGISLEEVDVPVKHLAGLKENVQKKLDSIRSYIVEINSNGIWDTNISYDDDSESYIEQTIELPGIRETDNPMVGLKNMSTTSNGIKKEQDAYSCIDMLITNNDSVSIRCFGDPPDTNLTLWLTCV